MTDPAPTQAERIESAKLAVVKALDELLNAMRDDPKDRASAVVRLNIKKQDNAEDQRPIDEGCGCMVCQRYTRAYLRHLFASGEPLGATLNSIHNLAFYMETMARVRGDLSVLAAGQELLEAARAHTRDLDANTTF